MQPKTEFRLKSAGVFALCAPVLCWLMWGHNSPLEKFFERHETISHWWGSLNTIPYVVSLVASGNLHSGSEAVLYLAVAAQWFVAGFILTSLAQSVRGD